MNRNYEYEYETSTGDKPLMAVKNITVTALWFLLSIINTSIDDIEHVNERQILKHPLSLIRLKE